MKRCRLGAAALVLLLVFGGFSSFRLRIFCSGVVSAVEEAGAAAQKQDWSGARASTERARDSWTRGRSMAAVFSDHAPLEQVDTLLALLDTALARRDGAVFADVCAQLITTLNALSEAHQLSPENLL